MSLLAALAPPATAQVDRQRAAEIFKEAQALCEKDGGRLWGISICAPMVIGDADTDVRYQPAATTHAQQTTFGSPVGPHPQPLPPAAFASASRTQHAFALVGTGPPQHEFASFLFPIALSVVAVIDIAVLLIRVSTRCSPVNDEDAAHCKRTQRAYSSDGRRD